MEKKVKIEKKKPASQQITKQDKARYVCKGMAWYGLKEKEMKK